MQDSWYMKDGSSEFGPVSARYLKALATQGRIGRETLVRRADFACFVQAGSIRGLLDGRPGSATPGAKWAALARQAVAWGGGASRGVGFRGLAAWLRGGLDRSLASIRRHGWTRVAGVAAAVVILAGGVRLLAPGGGSLDGGLAAMAAAPPSGPAAPTIGGAAAPTTQPSQQPARRRQAKQNVGDSRRTLLGKPAAGARAQRPTPPRTSRADPSQEDRSQAGPSGAAAVQELRDRLSRLDAPAAGRRGGGRSVVFVPRTPGAVMAASVGSNLGRAAGSALDARSQSQQADQLGSQRVAEARKVFWRLYPDRPGFDEASQVFAKELLNKDVAMMLREGMVRVTSSGNPMSRQRFSPAKATRWMLGSSNAYDGGVADNAVQLFSAWVKASFPTTATMTFSNLNSAQTAFTKNRHLYDCYVLARDRYEFWKAGRELDLFPTAESMATYIARVGLGPGPRFDIPMSQDAAAAWVRDTRELFGAQAFKSAFDAVRLAPKDADGSLKDPEALGLHPFTGHLGKAAAELCGRHSDRAYALWLLYHSKDPAADLDALCKQHGTDTVYDAVRKVRTAPRRDAESSYVLADSFVRRMKLASIRPDRAFREMLDRLDQSSAVGQLVGLPNRVDGKTIKGDGDQLNGHVAFDGRRLFLLRHNQAAGAENIDLLVFDAATQKHRMTASTRRPTDCKFSSPRVEGLYIGSSKYAAVANSYYQPGRYRMQGMVQLLNTETGEALPPLVGPEPPASARSDFGNRFGKAVAVDGGLAAIGAPGTPFPSWVRPDQTVSDGGAVHVYRIGDRKPLYTLRPERRYFESEYAGPRFGNRLIARDGRLIVLLDGFSREVAAVVYDLATGNKIAEAPRSGGDVETVDAAVFGDSLALLTYARAQPNTPWLYSIAVHSLRDGGQTQRLDKRFSDKTRRVLLSDRLLAVADEEKLTVFDRATGAERGEAPFKGEVRADAGSGRAPGTLWDLDPTINPTHGPCLMFEGNPYSTGHCAWYFDLSTLDD
ncbi:MAG: DUF4339 domain-containing protein [Planctomycetota bacterium]